MKRFLLALAGLILTACTTATPAAAPAATPAEAPCNPALSLVNATAWVQQSAEYRANALQAFAAAQRALDQAVADPHWVGAQEETNDDPSQPPAIILDLDETVLDNTPFEARMIRAGKMYDAAAWKQWTSEGAAPAIPGAPEFLQYAKSLGVRVFYITNRDVDEEPGTRKNLERLGYPLEKEVDTLLLKGTHGFDKSDKGPRRAYVAASYRVLLLLGDDLNDFTAAHDKSQSERATILEQTRTWWGTRWFIIPNPVYGSWERAVTGGKGSACEQMQKKIDALRDR